MNPHGHDAQGRKLTKSQKKREKRRRLGIRLIANGLKSSLSTPDRKWFSFVTQNEGL